MPAPKKKKKSSMFRLVQLLLVEVKNNHLSYIEVQVTEVCWADCMRPIFRGFCFGGPWRRKIKTTGRGNFSSGVEAWINLQQMVSVEAGWTFEVLSLEPCCDREHKMVESKDAPVMQNLFDRIKAKT